MKIGEFEENDWEFIGGNNLNQSVTNNSEISLSLSGIYDPSFFNKKLYYLIYTLIINYFQITVNLEIIPPS